MKDPKPLLKKDPENSPPIITIKREKISEHIYKSPQLSKTEKLELKENSDIILTEKSNEHILQLLKKVELKGYKGILPASPMKTYFRIINLATIHTKLNEINKGIPQPLPYKPNFKVIISNQIDRTNNLGENTLNYHYHSMRQWAAKFEDNKDKHKNTNLQPLLQMQLPNKFVTQLKTSSSNINLLSKQVLDSGLQSIYIYIYNL